CPAYRRVCLVSFFFRRVCARRFFFSTVPPPPEISALSLHDALPICDAPGRPSHHGARGRAGGPLHPALPVGDGRRRAAFRRVRADRKSTRLNSSHVAISYAVFCLKKKKSYTALAFVVPLARVLPSRG